MIPKSTSYSAIRDRVIVAKGSKRAMERMVRENGGWRAGWVLGFGYEKPIGASIDATPYQEWAARTGASV
jgi:hypothetical protein